MNLETLRDLFEHEIQDLYSAEEQILDALPTMIEKATDGDLQTALRAHLEETREQVRRLERIGEELDLELDGEKCKGMAGILKEGEDVVKKHADDREVRDAAIIASAQRVEHYEMASYGTARTYARMLGEEEAARLLEETLDEEKEADRKLTRVAEDHVNRQAMSGD